MNIKKLFLISILAILTVTMRSEAAATTTYMLNIESTPVTTEIEKSPVKTGKKKGIKELAKKYCISIFTGSMLGYTTGYIQTCIEKKFDLSVPMQLCLGFVETVTRTNILNAIQKDFDEYEITNSGPLIQFSSVIASWIAYFSYPVIIKN
jgi:hypothetical protein